MKNIVIQTLLTLVVLGCVMLSPNPVTWVCLGVCIAYAINAIFMHFSR